MKIALIGAGSYVFTRNLVRDLLTYPALSETTIALMDINEERLSYAKDSVQKIINAGNYPAKLIATLDRREALDGADGVICTIKTGDLDVWRTDLEIPAKYGVNICIGDTRGPSGIFRALRHIPVLLDISRDIEKYCPDAVFLNYTNPMAMLVRAVQEQTKVKITGLCHSVQGTAEKLAGWIGAPIDEITFLCAGINHQAFYLDYRWNGKDAYPLIAEAIKKPEIYNEEIVRNEIFLNFGYYVTESSGHNSEYLAWFRKRPDLLEKYCTGPGNNPGIQYQGIENFLKRNATWKEDFASFMNDKTKLQRGREYAAGILNAIIGDGTMFKFNGNVRNFGLIDNLPEGCAVEVPVLASRRGFEPMHVGPLPDQLALMVNTSARCEELAVQGCLEGDPKKIFYACAYDPLTSAVCSLAEIRQMVEEALAFNKPYIPHFKSLKV
ncbi:MAG: alpha-galactosidase [Treponema sp.]|nr:alpha-galactosidase [Treponema sp.]